MPRRASARNQPREETPPAPSASNQDAQPDPLRQLRTNWKWAAFSQFFFTFNHLFAMNDVSLNAIEEDLIHDTNIVLPRIMQRLLYTVSYDRKVTLDNWQTALRKQYRKRDPAANPIGPEPRVEEPDQESSPPPEEPTEPVEDSKNDQEIEGEEEIKENRNGDFGKDTPSGIPDSTRASTLERGISLGASVQGFSLQPSEIGSIQINQLGSTEEQEESKNWLDLPMLTKLDSLHLLTEWQFHHATRLRTLMRSDDENASWRIEPIGYDSKSNAYWLIGADRLWIQRSIPKPPRPKATGNSPLKRKRTAASAKATPKGKGRPAPTPAAKRPRIAEPEVTTGRSRAAKSQAKAKLDAQAKELAELNRQANALARSSSGLRTSTRNSPKKASPMKSSPPKPTGTRASKRLRGNEDEDEWQAVPEEWLNGEKESKSSTSNRKRGTKEVKTGLEDEGSEISELTELPEDSGKEGSDEEEDDDVGEGDEKNEAQHEEQPAKQEEVQPVLESVVAPVDDRGLEPQPVLPEGFIEWETLCVTLYEWEHIAERFEKATHYTEKALYKVLTNTIVPVVTEELREIERKEKLSSAITQRKRSSRLLIRQTEKEEAEAAERRRREELEKNSRALRQAARAKKEEEERERREMAREIRRREREEKERAKSEKSEDVGGYSTPADGSDMQVDVVGNGHDHAHPTRKQDAKLVRGAAGSSSQNGRSRPKATGSGSKTPVGEDWELDCEICLRRGINADDGTPMMSCGGCSKWQHIACHDYADQQAGRRRRNWDNVEFLCSQCRVKRAGIPSHNQLHQQHMPIMPGPGGHLAQHNPYMNLTTPYGSTNYSHSYSSVNGTPSYSHQPQMSDTRSGGHPPRPTIPHGQPHQQPYGAQLTFSHYQPQQRGFSSTAESTYGSSGHTQPYGYSSQSPYPQYATMNGGSQHYQQSTQARWNVNHTSAQRSISEQNPVTVPAPHPAAGDRNGPVPPAAARHWQQPVHQSPPPTMPPGPQFQYHNAAYPRGPS